jgi:acyl-coenzyme A synthetase/AMP-(fatty) acid ligase
MAAFMAPRYIEFAYALPYTDVGKLKREELATPQGPVWDARQKLK